MRADTILWQKKALDERWNRGASDCWESKVYNWARVATGQVFSLVAARTIWISMCLVLVLLCFSQSTLYWLLFVNETSDLITLVLANEAFFNSILVYVISLNCKNPVHATIKSVFIFSLLRSIGSCFVIFLKIFFVIERRVAFYFGKSFFPPLMIKDIRGLSQASKLR